MFELIRRGTLQLWRFKLAPPGINVYFTGRHGGVSNPPYDSLNLGFHVGDDPGLVKQNRAILSSMLGLDPARITSPRQRHTDVVAVLDRQRYVGAGSSGMKSWFDPCDGLLTEMKEVPLLLHFADCVPVALAGIAAGGPVVGLLHAGRKGLVAGIIKSGVDLMRRRFSLAPQSIVAAIGPAIGACCYEVDKTIASEFSRRFGNGVLAKENHLDLAAAAETDLTAAGLLPENIHVLELCTSCDANFYSYRRDGVTGRQGAIAWIE